MTYSGLIAFVIGISTVFSGFLFTLIVTRRLTPEEFGTWSILGTLIGYLIISERIISYWNYRQIARGEEVGKTSVISSVIFTSGTIPVFFLLAFFVSSQSNAILESLILGVVLVPVQYVSQTLSRINLAARPQAVSYGQAVFETAKIPAALSLVLIFDLGLNGAIIAVLVAYLIRIIVQIYFAKPKLRDQLNFGVLRRWLKLSWISLYTGCVRFLMTLDVLVYLIITSSIVGVAYYTASLVIANIVAHSALISHGLGPKLLATGDPKHIKENFALMMYFSIPLLGLAVIFSRPALFALNPLYEDAFVIAMILAFKVFFMNMGKVLQIILVNLERVDVETNPKFSSLIKSKLFLVPSIRYIFSGTYIVSLIIILTLFNGTDRSEFELITFWALVGLLVLEIPYFVIMWILVHKSTRLPFPYLQTIKYIGATSAFVIVFIFTSDSILNYEESIYDYLPSFIAQLLICVGIYVGITYLIDKRTRNILKIILTEITSKT